MNVSIPVTVPLSTTNANATQVVNDNTEQHLNDEVPLEEINPQTFHMPKPQVILLWRSQRERSSAIADDYVVYLKESDFDIGINEDPVSFSKPLKVKSLKNGLKPWKMS